MKENTIKAALATGLAAFTAYIGQLIIPIIILAVVMLIDYVTGLFKAWITSQLCSRTGIIGIIKKVGYLCIVIAGMAVDWVIIQGCSAVGIECKLEFLYALIVIIWLILNELISILENVTAAGAPVPKWLFKVIDKLKISVSQKIGEKGEDS